MDDLTYEEYDMLQRGLYELWLHHDEDVALLVGKVNLMQLKLLLEENISGGDFEKWSVKKDLYLKL